MSGRTIVLHAAWAAALAALGPDLWAGETGPGFQWPAFQDLRYKEDWSVLSRRPADAPQDWADPMKYVPLSRDGFVWASFGGQVRERVEVWDNFSFGAANDDTFALTRCRLHTDLHIGPDVRLFIEGRSAHSSDRDLPGGKRATDVDQCDLENAFLDVTPFRSGNASVTFRAGRQEMTFGSGRLIASADWTNTRRTFDGAAAIVQVPNWTITTFWGHVVLVDRFQTNHWDNHTEVYGIYAAHKVNKDLTWDLYSLGFKNEAATFNTTKGAERRWTVGSRLGGKIAGTGFDFDVEGAGQFGTLGGEDIRAGMFASQLGYTIAKAPATPRLFVGFDYASGDKKAGGDVRTFNSLYPNGHPYFGYIDIIGRQNIVDCSTGIEVKPHKKVFLSLHGHCFHRADTNDALYNAGGAVVRAGNTGSSSDVGREVDLLLRYQLDRHQTILGGYSHFFPGTFLKQSGAHEGIDFSYLSWQLTF